MMNEYSRQTPMKIFDKIELEGNLMIIVPAPAMPPQQKLCHICLTWQDEAGWKE